MATSYWDDRYIYFTKTPFPYNKTRRDKSFFRQHLKMNDIVMVSYSEDLYWYLKELGVLGIKSVSVVGL